MGRAPCCEKVGLKRGRWTAEEDEILVKYIQANGEGSWRSLPKNAGLLRCGKSCRLRWINYLRTDLKRGNISAEEEDTIVKLHTSFGNRWSLIASHLPGRTDNEIKNYWNSHLSRRIYSFRKVAGTGIMDINRPPPPKRKGGRTSRWAMKKNKGYTYTQSPKQTVTKVQNSEAAVPMPHPPSSLNNETEESIEKVEPMDQVNTRTCEKDLDHEGTNEKETYDDIMGLFEVENSNGGGGALCFGDDMMMEDSCLLLEEACGVSTLSEERETNVGVVDGEYERMNGDGDVGPNKMASSHEDPECSGNLSSNGESTREWSSNMGLGLDDNYYWDWESVMEFNDCNDDDNSNNEHDAWEHKEDLLTWLWEDDDWENDSSEILGEIDLQKQNDLLIARFLS